MGEKQYCLWENRVFENFFNLRISQIPRFTWRNESKMLWIVFIFKFLSILMQYKLDVRDFTRKTDFRLWWTDSSMMSETKQKNLTGSCKDLQLLIFLFCFVAVKYKLTFSLCWSSIACQSKNTDSYNLLVILWQENLN